MLNINIFVEDYVETSKSVMIMTNLHVKELILKWVFLLVKSLGQWHTFWTCGLWIVYGKKNIGKKQNFNLKLIEFFFGENVEKK